VGDFSRICTVPEAGEKMVALATGDHPSVTGSIDCIFLFQRLGPIHVSVYVTSDSQTGN